MPVPKAAWLKLPAAARGKLTYQQYVSWANKKTAARAKAAAANTPSWVTALQPLPSSVLGMMARNQVQSQTGPIIKQITASINRQRGMALSDLDRRTGQILGSVAPIAGQIGRTYDQSIGQAKAIDEGLANFLQSTGQATSGEINNQLGAAGVAAPAGFDISKASASSSALSAARSETALDQLLQNRATNVGYAQQQPGFIRRQSLNQRAALQANYANQLGTAIGQITGQVPSMVNTAYQNLLDREVQKAGLLGGFSMDQKRIDASNAAATNKAIAAAIPKINARNSDNANDGRARDAYGHLIPDGHGGYVPWTPHSPKTPGAPTSKDEQKRLDAQTKQIGKFAATLHSQMMNKLGTMTKPSALSPNQTPTRVYGPAAAKNIVAHARENALTQVLAQWKQAYPDKPDKWIQQHAAQTLIGAGWTRAAQELTGTAPPTPTAPQTPSQKLEGVLNQRAVTLLTGVPKGIDNASQAKQYVAYGRMVNYILSSAQSLGVPNMNLNNAKKVAFFMMNRLGYWTELQTPPDPRERNPKWTPYVPPGSKAPPPVSGAGGPGPLGPGGVPKSKGPKGGAGGTTGGGGKGPPYRPGGPTTPKGGPTVPVRKGKIQDTRINKKGILTAVKINGHWWAATPKEQQGWRYAHRGIVGKQSGNPMGL